MIFKLRKTKRKEMIIYIGSGHMTGGCVTVRDSAWVPTWITISGIEWVVSAEVVTERLVIVSCSRSNVGNVQE